MAEEDSEYRFYRNNFIANYIDHVCFAVIHVNESGPAVLWEGISDNFEGELKSTWREAIETMAVNYMVTLGMGYNFSEGVYELPLPHTDKFRTLVCCINKNDQNRNLHDDSEDSYFQVVIKVPTVLLAELHSPTYYGQDMIIFLKNIIGLDNTMERLNHLKPEILYFLSDQIVRNEIL